MGKYFGTDGFRGEANVNLTVEHAFKVGRFLGWYYGQKKPDERCRIVIGKDTRRSSYMFEYSLVAGLTASGADVFLLHVTTTPSVSYVVRTEGFNCGIMISASHNPYYDNGIKVINEKGEKLEESVIVEIEKYLDGEMGEIPLAKKDKIGRTVDFAAGRNRYIGYLISIATRSFKNMKVALDCANGSASAIAKNVFDALGAETHVISNEPNGLNINTDCGSTHIEHLQKFVVEEGCDVGFAYDGDADRCIAVDEKGNMYVALANVDREKDQNVMLDVKGVDVSGRDIEIQRLESDKITDENTLEAPDKVSVQTEKTKMPEGQIIKLKKHSFAIVKILAEEQVVEKADYSKVDAALANIPKDLSLYTKESVAKLEEAKEAVVRDLDITKQAEVDKMAEAIQKAIDNLKKKANVQPTPDNKPNNSVTTGDGTMILLMIMLVVVSGGTIFIADKKRRNL